jgi:hypothetical protein
MLSTRCAAQEILLCRSSCFYASASQLVNVLFVQELCCVLPLTLNTFDSINKCTFTYTNKVYEHEYHQAIGIVIVVVSAST